jgi:serine/threonine protein kinase
MNEEDASAKVSKAFLDQTLDSAGSTPQPPSDVFGNAPATSEPTLIGPYQLLRKIGEGGMGQVWLAEQSEPVRRQVALKLIKVGVYDDGVLKRFQAERQSLAMMDHPAISISAVTMR